MNYFLAFLLAHFFLSIIICLTTVHVTVHFQRKGKDDLLVTNVKAWFGFIRMQYEVSIIQLSQDLSGVIYQTEMESPAEPVDQKNFKVNPQEMLQFQRRLQSLIKRIHVLHRIVKKFLKTIRLDCLEWKSAIGTGDAAETGVLTGVSWGIKSTLVGVIRSYLTLRTIPKLDIQPHFQEKKLETELLCMFRLRIGHAILAGLRMLLNLRKRRDGKWQSTPFKA